MDGSFFVVLCRRSERAGLGVHEIVDHVENMDGFKLLPGAAPRQMRSRGAVVGKRRDHRDRFPFPIQPLLAQNAIRIRHSCRAVRLVERISIRAVRRVSCFRRVQSGPFAGAPQRGLHDLLRKRPHQRMLCQRADRICRRADCFCGARPGDQLCPGEETLKAQVKDKIAQWATVNIARGNSLWDIRKAVCLADLSSYTFHTSGNTIDQEYWTGAAYALADGQNPSTTPKNEPGNQAGLQAAMYAAARVLKDDAETTNRLHALGVAAIDDLFGRNPTGTAAFYHFKRDFEGADLGWYKQYQGGAGRLEGCTAVIDANAPEFCYRNGACNPSKDYQNNSSPTPRAGSPITRRGMLLWPTVRRKMLRCLSTRRAAMWATR